MNCRVILSLAVVALLLVGGIITVGIAAPGDTVATLTIERTVRAITDANMRLNAALYLLQRAIGAAKAGNREELSRDLTAARVLIDEADIILGRAAKYVNVRCPITGARIDVNVDRSANRPTREYKGHRVGFSDDDAVLVWDKLPDAEKDARLEAAIHTLRVPTAQEAAAASTDQGAAVTSPSPGGTLDRVNAPVDLAREYRGRRVGLSPADCSGAWDRQSGSDKDARVRAAMPSR